MVTPNSKHELNSTPAEEEKTLFADKFKDLLPGVEFNEPIEMLEARIAVMDALTGSNQSPDFLRYVWTEYGKVCEQAVDNEYNIHPHNRAQIQIAILVHKALIFHEIGDTQRYGEDLIDAEEYAYNMFFDEIADAIGTELDGLTN